MNPEQELLVNQGQLTEVAEMRAYLNSEWERLQEEREEIIGRLVMEAVEGEG